MSRGRLGEGVSCGMGGLGPDSVYPLSKQDPNCGTTTGARQVLSAPRVGMQGAALGSRQKPLKTEIVPLFLQIAQLQQVYADWRQCLRGTIPPAVPVCGRG